jgi:hypothetical protein
MQRTHFLHFLQLLKPKRLVAQPWLNGGQKLGSGAISVNPPMRKAHFLHFLQLLEPKRLVAQPWLNGGQKSGSSAIS